jgi:hypothetical protein
MPEATQSVRRELFGQQNARTVISTAENLAQGAAEKKQIIEELLGGLKLALDMVSDWASNGKANRKRARCAVGRAS